MPDRAAGLDTSEATTPIFDEVCARFVERFTRHPWDPQVPEPFWPSTLTGAIDHVKRNVALSTPTQAMEVITHVNDD